MPAPGACSLPAHPLEFQLPGGRGWAAGLSAHGGDALTRPPSASPPARAMRDVVRVVRDQHHRHRKRACTSTSPRAGACASVASSAAKGSSSSSRRGRAPAPGRAPRAGAGRRRAAGIAARTSASANSASRSSISRCVARRARAADSRDARRPPRSAPPCDAERARNPGRRSRRAGRAPGCRCGGGVEPHVAVDGDASAIRAHEAGERASVSDLPAPEGPKSASRSARRRSARPARSAAPARGRLCRCRRRSARREV